MQNSWSCIGSSEPPWQSCNTCSLEAEPELMSVGRVEAPSCACPPGPDTWEAQPMLVVLIVLWYRRALAAGISQCLGRLQCCSATSSLRLGWVCLLFLVLVTRTSDDCFVSLCTKMWGPANWRQNSGNKRYPNRRQHFWWGQSTAQRLLHHQQGHFGNRIWCCRYECTVILSCKKIMGINPKYIASVRYQRWGLSSQTHHWVFKWPIWSMSFCAAFSFHIALQHTSEHK